MPNYEPETRPDFPSKQKTCTNMHVGALTLWCRAWFDIANAVADFQRFTNKLELLGCVAEKIIARRKSFDSEKKVVNSLKK